jgi:hypothetical protein
VAVVVGAGSVVAVVDDVATTIDVDVSSVVSEAQDTKARAAIMLRAVFVVSTAAM